MKYKTLRYKEGEIGDEYCHVINVNGNDIKFSGKIPQLFPMTMTLDKQKEFYKELCFDNVEVITLDIINSDEVGADIRNKLSPPLNLVEMLEVYFKGELHTTKLAELKQLIRKEMEMTKKSIDYLAELL